MYPQYQFNLNGVDPLLVHNPNQYPTYQESLDYEIQRLNDLKQKLPRREERNTLWADIEKEVSSLNNDQKIILAKDSNYIRLEEQLQILVQQELLNLVKDKISNSEQGQKILKQQLEYIKEKKDKIVEQSNKELELFKKFQIAVQANPNLTYPEFIKTISHD